VGCSAYRSIEQLPTSPPTARPRPATPNFHKLRPTQTAKVRVLRLITCFWRSNSLRCAMICIGCLSVGVSERSKFCTVKPLLPTGVWLVQTAGRLRTSTTRTCLENVLCVLDPPQPPHRDPSRLSLSILFALRFAHGRGLEGLEAVPI
jgi:hypothetical protein